MNENLTEAFILLAVGMITVFAILALVVQTGNLLIKITNRYAPPQPVQKETSRTTETPNNILSPTPSTSFNKSKLAAIIGAVEHITQGTGRVEKIEKV